MTGKILLGDCRLTMRTLEANSIQTCITSPPYFGLRDYGHDGQIGLEASPDEYVAKMVEVFAEVHRLLRDDGTLWLNLGDSYARPPAKGGSGPGGKNREWYGDNYGQARGAEIPDGLKPKDLIGIPWRVAFALQAAGWYLRQDIIWSKPNPMPESVRDRCTKAHEYLFLLSKSPRYYFDAEAIKEPAVTTVKRGPALHPDKKSTNGNSGLSRREPTGTRNRRSVWTVPTRGYKGAHFAVFPTELIRPCILAGSCAGDVVLDPFMGSGTTAQVAQELGRSWIGCEINPEYALLQRARTGWLEAQDMAPEDFA